MLPSLFEKKRKKPCNGTGGSTPKGRLIHYDRDILCLPDDYCSDTHEIIIPRGKARERLGKCGLMGKIRINSSMSEEEIFAEIRSVFHKPMRENSSFQFEILQRSGGGSKSLTVPAVSSTFEWTAKQVVNAAGQGCIYIIAVDKLMLDEAVKKEVNLYHGSHTYQRDCHYCTEISYKLKRPYQKTLTYITLPKMV